MLWGQSNRMYQYSENDLLFLLPLHNDLRSITLESLLRQCNDFWVAKEDY